MSNIVLSARHFWVPVAACPDSLALKCLRPGRSLWLSSRNPHLGQQSIAGASFTDEASCQRYSGALQLCCRHHPEMKVGPTPHCTRQFQRIGKKGDRRRPVADLHARVVENGHAPPVILHKTVLLAAAIARQPRLSHWRSRLPEPFWPSRQQFSLFAASISGGPSRRFRPPTPPPLQVASVLCPQMLRSRVMSAAAEKCGIANSHSHPAR